MLMWFFNKIIIVCSTIWILAQWAHFPIKLPGTIMKISKVTDNRDKDRIRVERPYPRKLCHQKSQRSARFLCWFPAFFTISIQLRETPH
nr:hypothetical transcript [Hymenolepis microstoma]